MGTGFIDSTTDVIIKYLRKNGIEDINIEEINNIVNEKNTLDSQGLDFLDKMKRDFKHVFLDDGVYITEKKMLKKRFDFKGKTW